MIDAYEQGLIDAAEFQSRIVPLRGEHDREVAALASLRGRLSESDDVGSAERVLTSLCTEVDARLADPGPQRFSAVAQLRHSALNCPALGS